MTTHNGKKITQRGGMDGEYGNMYAMLSGADMEYFKNRVPQKTSTKENTSCDSCGAGEGEGCSPNCLNQVG